MKAQSLQVATKRFITEVIITGVKKTPAFMQLLPEMLF